MDLTKIGQGVDVVSSVANPILSYIGAQQQRDFESAQAQQQREWNEAMMDKQNAWSLDMWNRTNAYNSPAAQKQRLLDAGLNPLYYGLDGSSANGVESAQALGYDRASMSGMTNPLQSGVNAALQTRAIQTQAKLNEANANKAETESDLAREKTITESLLRDRQYDLMGVNIDLGNANVKLTQEKAKEVASNIAVLEKQVDQMDADIVQKYVQMNVAERSQQLAEDTFQFTKALEIAKLNLEEKRIAVAWYNANTARLVGEADIELKGAQKIYVDLEGEQVKAVTATENAMREGRVAKQNLDIKTGERSYKWMPAEKILNVVGTTVGIASGVMLGTTGAGAVGRAASKAYGYTVSE